MNALTAPGLARNPYIAATYVNSIRQMRAIAYCRERIVEVIRWSGPSGNTVVLRIQEVG